MTSHPFGGAAPEWWPWWRGETCVVVASGPSAQGVPIELAKGEARFIAVNDSWKLAPWADWLHACDFNWWKQNDGCPEFTGIKTCVDRRITSREEWGARHVQCRKHDDRPILNKFCEVGWGGNSGFHAMQLAAQCGCSKVILVGFDMSIRHGLHWHGAHPAGMNNPTGGNVERWRRAVDAAASQFKAAGVTVVNCSAVSALKNYPKMTFAEALAL